LNNTNIEEDLSKLRGRANPLGDASQPEQTTQAGIDETTDTREDLRLPERMQRLKKTTPTWLIEQYVIDERDLPGKILIHTRNQDGEFCFWRCLLDGPAERERKNEITNLVVTGNEHM
jgi:hypothetical protein